MVNLIGPVPVISAILPPPRIGTTMVAKTIQPKIRMTTTMGSLMLMILVPELPIHLLALRGFLTQQQTSMVMVAEILMKTRMMMVMDLKTQQTIVQPSSEHQHSVLKAVLTPMVTCGRTHRTIAQLSMEIPQKAV